MWGPTSDAQDRVIRNKTRTEEHIMMIMSEPFQKAEIEYRQRQASQLYDKKPSRRRHRWVGRLPSLRLPRPVASLGGRGVSQTAK